MCKGHDACVENQIFCKISDNDTQKKDSLTRWRSSEVMPVQLLYMYSERMLKMGGGQVTNSLTLVSHWKNRARAGEDVGCNVILLSTVCTQLSLAMKTLCPEIASGLWHLE